MGSAFRCALELDCPILETEVSSEQMSGREAGRSGRKRVRNTTGLEHVLDGDGGGQEEGRSALLRTMSNRLRSL